MSKIADQVREFHETFGCDIAPEGYLGFGGDELRCLRFNLLVEEFQEYEDASDVQDIVEVADALADMVYVIYGTALSFGIDLDAVLDAVHASNMSKLTSEGEVLRREDGKILKSEQFFRPRIAEVLGL